MVRTHNAAATLAYLARLEREHGQVAPSPSSAPASHSSPAIAIEKATRDFAAVAVPPMPSSHRPVPAAWVDDKNEAVRHYRGSTYVAIGAIARRVAMQPAKVFARRRRKSGEQRIPVPHDHPLQVLFEFVNDFATQFDLWFSIVGWRLITGDAYLWKTRNGFDVPAELWPLPSQWVHALPSPTSFIGGYLVRGVFGQDVTLPTRDVIHFAEPGMDWSGNGRFYGRAPLMAGASMVDVESAMLARLYHQFKNFAPPGLHYTTDAELTSEQLKEIYHDVLIMHGRAEQTGAPIVSHSGMKAGEWRTSPREMDYANSLDKAMEYTLAVFGVPKAVVGLTRETNRANMEAALVAFAQNTVNPLLVHMSQHLTQGFAGDFDDDLEVCLPLIDTADLDLMRRVIETATKAKAVTPNEVREILLDLAPYKVGGNTPTIGGTEALADFGNDAEEIEAAAGVAAGDEVGEGDQGDVIDRDWL